MIDSDKVTSRNLPPRTRYLLYIAVAAAWIWFLWPILFSAHVEAFSARIMSAAILDAKGWLGLNEQAYPLLTQYLFSSRQLTVIALELLMKLTHSTGDINFRILIISSYILFVCASFLFVQRWSGKLDWPVFAAWILVPGLVEISFFFADNLPSAAFAVAAIALVSPKAPMWRWLFIGALFATSVLFRLDGLFALPSIFIVALVDNDISLKKLFHGFALFSAGAIPVFLTSGHFTGITLANSLRITSYFAGIHTTYSSWHDNLENSFLLFFGLPGFMLLILGCARNWRTQTRRQYLCLTVYPLFLYFYYSVKAIETRDFLLLGAPFLLLQVSAGIRELCRLLRASSWQRLLAFGICGVCALYIAAPPFLIFRDGPRAKRGRLWTPPIWHAWQTSVKGNFDRCDQLIQSAKPGEHLLIITSQFNAEAYFHLRLVQNGYDIERTDSATPYGQADLIAEKSGTKFLEIRTESPYAILALPPMSQPAAYTQAFQLSRALAGTAAFSYDRAFLLTWGDVGEQEFLRTSDLLSRVDGPTEFVYLRRFPRPVHVPLDGVLRAIPLSHQDVDQLRNLTDSEVRTAEAGAGGKWHPMRDFMQMHDHLTLPFWNP